MPDNQIIQKLSAIPLNKQLLSNWLTELVDFAEDALEQIVRDDILTDHPVLLEKSNYDQLVLALLQLNSLDDEVYYDFKLIIYETLFQAFLTISTKVLLHKLGWTSALVDDFLHFIAQTEWNQKNTRIAREKSRLLLSMLELGCDTKCLKQIFLAMLENQHTSEPILDLLLASCKQFPAQFPFFLLTPENLPLSVPMLDFLLKTFTLHTWFRISDQSDMVPLFLLTSPHGTTLFIRLSEFNQVIIEVVDTSHSRMTYTFNRIAGDKLCLNRFPNVLHITIRADQFQNVSLFVNGEKAELIPCPALGKAAGFWSQLNIGGPEFAAAELLFSDLTVLDCSISDEWIAAIYALGPGIDWSTKELPPEAVWDILSQITPYNLTLLGTQVAKPRSKADLAVADKAEIAAALQESAFKPANVAFCSADPDFLHHAGSFLFVPASFYGSLHCLGGANLLIFLLERIFSDRKNLGLKTLEFVLTCTSGSWRIYKEFENNGSFTVLPLLLLQQKEQGVLDLSLRFSVNSANSEECLICDSTIFRKLVLNFTLYRGSPDLPALQSHLANIVGPKKFRKHNLRELGRVKLVKRLTQFMRCQVLQQRNPFEEPSQVDQQLVLQFVNSALNSDKSVESARSLARFVIFALHHSQPNRELGITVLYTLTDEFFEKAQFHESLKRFSRSITIHWILLLLQCRSQLPEEEKIAARGVELLLRLLQVLGGQIIRRFFQQNRGLEVLTHFLSPWWLNDHVMWKLVCAAFGIFSAEEFQYQNLPLQLKVPEFLLILTNMALAAMCDTSGRCGEVVSVPSLPASRKLDDFSIFSRSSHLAGWFVEFIRVGFSENAALRSYFSSPEWLEPALELLGHLRLLADRVPMQFSREFRQNADKLTETLAKIFQAHVVSVKDLFAIFKLLSDFSVKLVLSFVFPVLFSRLQKDSLEAVRSTELLLEFYWSDYVMQKYAFLDSELQKFLDSALLVMEADEHKKWVQATHRAKLKSMIGQAVVFHLAELSEKPNLSEELGSEVRSLSYKQVLLLQHDVVGDTHVAQTAEVLMGLFVRLEPGEQSGIAEHFLNYLRAAYIMRPTAFTQVVQLVALISDYDGGDELVRLFFELLVTRNDDEIIHHLQKFPALRHIFAKSLHFRLAKLAEFKLLNVLDMAKVTLASGGRLAYMNAGYIQNFERDCGNLKARIIKEELTKYNRELQDASDSAEYASARVGAGKTEVLRLFNLSETPSSYVLDYIEGADRMRKLFVVEDQLAESEKLYYSTEVPVRQPDDLPEQMDSLGLSQASFSETLGDPFADDFQLVETQEDTNRRVIRSLYVGDRIQAIWNVSRINGLQAVESLLIVGQSHVYILENYSHCADGNVVDSKDAPPETKDPYLQLINSQSGNSSPAPTHHHTRLWLLDKLALVTKRKFLLRDVALEMFFAGGASILVTCLSTKERDQVFGKLVPFAHGRGLDRDLAEVLAASPEKAASGSGISVSAALASRLASAFSNSSGISAATKKWQAGELSNFYYLMVVNTVAGRTFNDLTQYPVFPWVIADYDSEVLDFSNPETFRDLSQPMGAQSAARKNQFHERYEALASLSDDNSPPFHYGTHYSLAMIVLSYLIRIKPYVQSYLLLQGGKFDHAERLFNSVEKAWLSASRDNTTDVRELTPEFFYLPEFLVNSNDFEFGKLQNGKSVGDVELPKWAHGDPKIFVAKNREALESPYVSAHLHKWIDLVFGYKQTGDEAVKNLNVFHHSSYDGAINVDDIQDEVERRAVIGMINNFGQTPMQVFAKPHAEKCVLNYPNLYMLMLDSQRQPPRLTFESKLRLPVERLEISSKLKKWIGRPAFVASQDEMLIRRNTRGGDAALQEAASLSLDAGSLIVNGILHMNLHLAPISALLQLGEKRFVTGATDGMIYVWQGGGKVVRFHTALRGHTAEIKQLRFSLTFKVGLSADAEGNVLVWDFSRFSFVRQLAPPPQLASTRSTVLVDVSNDTGDIATVYSSRYSNIVTVYTLNGDILVQSGLPPGTISAVAFAGMNLLSVDRPEVGHVFWSNGLLAVCYATPRKNMAIYEITHSDAGEWCIALAQVVNMEPHVTGTITAVQLFRHSETDHEDKLARGRLSAVLGDALGRVYCM